MKTTAGSRLRCAVSALAAAVAIACIGHASAANAQLETPVISADGSHFVLKESGKKFTPWGFNYLGEFDTVLEEYWTQKWVDIEEDFREMRKLGANVIRVHLQMATFMSAADQTKADELARLKKLLDFAQSNGLYLDLTGLGCYQLAKIPTWLDALDEKGRWAAQANFWSAIAKTCRGHSAVFCYNLMNEPVIGEAKKGEQPWLTGELGGFYFVQRISNQPGKRTQQEIATAWVEQMAKAIRHNDPAHLITVGVIPWAMIWPTAMDPFYASDAAKQLDFVSVHFYPQAGKVKEALAALKSFQIGKPIVIEETFPLSCSLGELEEFMKGAVGIADGWISHYFGKSIADYREEKDAKSAAIAEFLEFWKGRAPAQ